MNMTMRSVLFVGFCAISSGLLSQGNVPANKAETTSPKLVVGIVVDQMRWDFLYRYTEKYSDNGFKRLLREGYSCANTHIPYSPTYTACGHACIYTGTVPAIHGVTGNDWYDLNEGKRVYCTEDTSVRTVGSTSAAGKMSPHRMLTTTITDELRLATNFRSKTIGVALKDRGAILPAGHSANAAYFFDAATGNWITSTYFMDDLPAWVKSFNEKQLPKKYLEQNWNTLLPIAQYVESTEDDRYFEMPFKNEKNPVFEHKVGELKKLSLDVIRSTPYGNVLTLDFSKAVIENEKLGQGEFPDFLAISLSSPDYIGHQFGPNSVEAQDCYLRLDKQLGDFFDYLDKTVGQGNYLLFLTADHGAAHVPDFLKERKIPAGVFMADSILKELRIVLEKKFGQGNWILGYENMHIYLNNGLMAQRNINRQDFKQVVSNFFMTQIGVARTIDLENLSDAVIPEKIRNALTLSHYPERSGEIYILLEPGWFEEMTKGTTHGTIYPYDTHIPLIWMGWHVKQGEDYTEVSMTDIAPTLAALLRIQEPNGSIGKVIEGLLEK